VKPRLLDLFCGAGGATAGYQRAGFHVTGVDTEPQPNYCGDEFVQSDALLFDLSDFDAVHASPPCQSYSVAFRHMATPKPKLLDAVLSRFRASGLPWVIENVVGAPLPSSDTLFGDHGVELCGTMFGLRIRRHRLFQTSSPISAPGHCDHSAAAMNPHNQAGRDRIYTEFGRQDPEAVWRREMGVDWMVKRGGRDAVPPAYTEHIGTQLKAHLEAAVLS
jgi:DNA (cytosine-5)-methyltransferase 1